MTSPDSDSRTPHTEEHAEGDVSPGDVEQGRTPHPDEPAEG